MRAMLAATILLCSGMVARAQMSQPSTVGTTPKRVATTPVRPGGEKPTQAADATAQAERLALQSDLAWVGQYNGAITGDLSERMNAAIKEYQKSQGGKPTGVLDPQQRNVLAETARRRQKNVGWTIVTDSVTGARLGIPTKLVPQQTSDGSGTKWSSPAGTIQILLARRKQAGPTTAKLAEAEKREPPGRSVDYAVVKPDFFVLSGLQGQKKFYVRGTFKGDEVRIMTILYDQTTENTVGPVVIAMSSAFNAFPSASQAAPARKTVEYGTGVIVSDDGAIVTDREITDGCLAITIPGFGNVDRVAEDRVHGLALLHIYGTRNLKPLALAGGTPGSAVDLIGIADPQNQGGGNSVSRFTARRADISNDRDAALSPPPGLGFSGAAALDAAGKFAGLALLRPVVVAGASNATAAAAQAVLVAPDTVRRFLKANGVDANGSSSDAKAAAVRVICVRK